MKNKILAVMLSVVMCIATLFSYDFTDIRAYEDDVTREPIVYERFEKVTKVDSIVLKTPEMKPESVLGNGLEINIPTKELTIEERIKESCDKYGIPFDIVLAIARLETGWFKSNAFVNGNNPGGVSHNVNGEYVPIYFDTIEEGVEVFVSNLANNYFGIGLDTVAEIGAKYCPSNPGWITLVEEMRHYDTGL